MWEQNWLFAGSWRGKKRKNDATIARKEAGEDKKGISPNFGIQAPVTNPKGHWNIEKEG